MLEESFHEFWRTVFWREAKMVDVSTCGDVGSISDFKECNNKEYEVLGETEADFLFENVIKTHYK